MTIPRVRITEVCDIVAGQAPNSKTYNENGQGTLFVRAGDYGSLYPSSKTFTTHPIAFGKEGDVFLCVVGATSGKVNLGINASITRSIFALRPNELVLQKYLYYYLKSMYETLNYMKSGSAQGIINKKTLDHVVIPLLTISQQAEITSILDKAFKLKEEREQANQVASKLQQAVFLQMFGDPVNNSKWIQKRMLDVSIAVESGSTPLRTKPENFDVKGIPLMKVENIGPSGYLAFKQNQLRISYTANSKQRRSALREDDVLINIVGPPLGKVAYVTKEFDGANINQAVVLIRPDPSQLNSIYLWSLLRFPSFNQMIINMSVSVRQANINLSEMRNLKIPVPLLELQEKFALIAKRIEQIREKQNSSKLEINKLFDSLVNKAFNGKLNTTVD